MILDTKKSNLMAIYRKNPIISYWVVTEHKAKISSYYTLSGIHKFIVYKSINVV